ncbi:hypothetical protein A2334_05505 [Candidatus Roizmanbacteria bacterium RIFOXYB2_FULL_38_10]|uniref:Type II secretion system protein GspG C-terminal domain-containing protein n=1 Tax=Candidatus Roizmanbacteria bacterium RIFOXYD1_FULL_38_12 TaxID=1802093 RepID=A0A1F7L0Q9_9BACT|nr:MAG: hypothetical protein A3K47_02625 [Candidatus Roizmanbacteria bacterium RIFOXYA2_FULL_38_14]OGK63663.1 MAG: hypothetical protein A3K27_02625 [Candidatus Roizmanbacteria bacterium RIFOXYA1_FULL_37_12]OGK65509.1 MAG: hypothetical protein A3K38_02625 [Candidatus Roizmanbacteria bacterium RIFOXYB1_FULL_40_23]OGK68293.1 MAG: hypothetical protein A2334_05505 [Candidatus Roizmanbacteria bacterium RIFOXYB2_FULL_38_10]OGK69914.1 MAG: hypothetical protein A3K21_02630 [Candidatus Roizmanbacteria ba
MIKIKQNSVQKGFTLLEMLIVLAIISIVITIASISYSTAQKKSRDSRRKSDLKVIQNAFEQYYSVCGYSYPVSSSGFVPTIGCSNPATVFLPTVPADPKGGTPYLMPTSSSSMYRICSYLIESESPTGYCLSNQQ